jgi:DNA-binding MarR family transcriptional regulator
MAVSPAMAPRDPLPPRIPPEGTANVLFQNFRTGMALRELMKPVFEGSGVSGEEYGVLGVVHFFPDRTPTELSDALGIPPTTVSRHVARFLEDGLVERRPNPEDGRSYLLRTTAQGKKIVQTIAPRLGKIVDALGETTDVPLPEISAALVALEEAARQLLPPGSI